ncbi:DUF6992 family protein [Saprospira grandis]|uniref:DUF6992 family protein n=1 Tax=Saprospira grandis TaxID=1008 RepID=UPI0022DE19C1|nr:hypothetical protein [Saprospira grandis]WBM76110.1 hypothetical protein OP864_07730 [Saprospira grandis]
MRTMILICLFLGSSLSSWGQDKTPYDYARASAAEQKKGMYLLGGWSLASLGVGALGYGLSQGEEERAFHEMNMIWGGINLAIIGGSILLMKPAEPGLSLADARKKQRKVQNIYLINTGLDLLYMGAGAALLATADRYPGQEAGRRGYGKSILLQGGFLFAYDGFEYLVQKRLGRPLFKEEGWSCRPASSSLGLALRYRFP